MASFVEEGVAAFGGAAAPGGPFVDLAGSLSSAAASQLSSNASMLRALLNMGVRFSATQEGTLSAIRADASVQAVMERLAAHLASHMFLAGERLSETDVAVALRLYDLLSLVYPQSACPSQYAAVARWFATVVQDARVRAFLASKGKLTGGTVRAGGQVDLRPDPVRVAALADASIARNAGYKKGASQRDAEKAATGKADAHGAGAGAAAAPAAGGAGAASAASSAPAAAAKQPEENLTLPDLPAEERISRTLGQLDAAGVAYALHRHAAAKTVEELLAAIGTLPGLKAKNLFVKAKKEKAAGDSRMWLVVAATDSDTNLVKLATKLGYGKIVIRFAEQADLVANLGVAQGHVSPFCLANDKARLVNVAIDAKLLDASLGPVFFHPGDNSASVAVTGADLLKFLQTTGHVHTVVDFSA